MKFVEPFIFFFTLGVYTFYPLFQQILFKNVCERSFNSDLYTCIYDNTLNKNVQEKTSRYMLIYNLIATVPSLIIPIVFSVYGVKYGSNILLLLPLIGDFISLCITGLYDTTDKFGETVFVILVALVNFIGSYGAGKALCNNYISAAIPPKNRQTRFFILEVICLIACTISGVFGGYCIVYLSYRISLYMCFGFCIAATLGLTFLKRVEFPHYNNTFEYQIIEEDKVEESYISRILPMKIRSSRIIREIPESNRLEILLFLLSEFFTHFGIYGALEIIVLYCLTDKFHFTAIEIGWLLSTTYFIKSIGTFVVFPVLIRFLKAPNYVYSLCNQHLVIGYFLMIVLGKNDYYLIFASLFVLLQGGIDALTLNTLSKTCDGSSRGMIFGIQSTISDMGASIGGVVATSIYMSTVHTSPGIAFIIMGIVMYVGTTLATLGFYISRNKSN